MSVKDDAWAGQIWEGLTLKTAVLGVVVGRKPDGRGKRSDVHGVERSDIFIAK